jgi:hypothetical protein
MKDPHGIFHGQTIKRKKEEEEGGSNAKLGVVASGHIVFGF